MRNTAKSPRYSSAGQSLGSNENERLIYIWYIYSIYGTGNDTN